MDVMLVFDAVVALFGAYMIGSALHMKKSGRINSMVLAQEELKKVKVKLQEPDLECPS